MSDDGGDEYNVNQFIERFPFNCRGGGTAMKKKSKTRRRKINQKLVKRVNLKSVRQKPEEKKKVIFFII